MTKTSPNDPDELAGGSYTKFGVNHARYSNVDLAEYLVPVNADIQEVEALFVPEDSQMNPLGIALTRRRHRQTLRIAILVQT
jgi:hypothetical protein